MSIASSGYFPIDVSSDNITQSVPSITAFAMSDASALVGNGYVIIFSIIYEAVITGFPALLANLIIHFYAINIFWVSISFPRSPLATIIPSATFNISS